MENSKSRNFTSFTDKRITDTIQTHSVSLLFDMNNKYVKLGVN